MYCRCEEYQIGRCIVQKAGQETGHPEELPRLLDTKICASRLQDQKCRDHRNEDTDEKYGNLLDRIPCEMILFADFLLRCAEGKESGDQYHCHLKNGCIAKLNLTIEMNALRKERYLLWKYTTQNNGCHDHDHHADEVFTSWGKENVPAISREKLEAVLHELAYSGKYGEVLRAKGMIPGETEGIWLHFDLVPEQVEIREGIPDYTGKLCVIGANLDEEGLEAAFKA